jgi:hypothetical protein
VSQSAAVTPAPRSLKWSPASDRNASNARNSDWLLRMAFASLEAWSSV